MVAPPLIEKKHGEWCELNGSPHYALSLPTCLYLARLCEVRKPTTILDLGSGFSSWLFRQFPADVVTVDNDGRYLAKTIEFCGGGEGFILWDDDLLRMQRTFDLVMVDYAGGEERDAMMGWAASRVSQRGAILFDDMHAAHHQEAAFEACKRNGFPLPTRLKAETTDSIGRYAVLATRDEGWTMPEEDKPAQVSSALDRALEKVHALEDELVRVSERLQSARAEAHQARVAGEIETR